MDVVFSGRDVGDLAAASSLDLSAKYSITDQVELGALIRSGVLDKGFDSVSSVTVGGEVRILHRKERCDRESRPSCWDVEELGVSTGYMYTKAMGGLSINSMLLLGWLNATARAAVLLSKLSSNPRDRYRRP